MVVGLFVGMVFFIYINIYVKDKFEDKDSFFFFSVMYIYSRFFSK